MTAGANPPIDPAGFMPVAAATDIAEGQTLACEVGGREVLVCNSGGQFFALENRCSHADAPLACGRIRAGWIACPAHGARFDLASGEALGPPASEAVRTYALRISDGMVEVSIGQD